MNEKAAIEEIFLKVAHMDLQSSAALFSAIATAAACFLIFSVARSAFHLWSERGANGIDEMELLLYLLRSLLLFSMLAAMMLYMKRNAWQ